MLIGLHHAKRARTISSNLHLKSSAKNGGSNWVLIQGAIFVVSIIVISGLLSLPSCYLENKVFKKAFKNSKLTKYVVLALFAWRGPIIILFLWKLILVIISLRILFDQLLALVLDVSNTFLCSWLIFHSCMCKLFVTVLYHNFTLWIFLVLDDWKM